MSSLKMFRGDNKTVNLRFTKNGVKQNITGWTIHFTAKRKLTDTDPQAIFQKKTTSGSGITIIDGNNGLAEVAIVPVDTSGLEDSEVSLICDVQAKDASSQVATTGYVNLVVQPDITRDIYSDWVKSICGVSLLQYLPLWETSGSVAFDQSASGYNGTASGSVAFGAPGIGDGHTCALFNVGVIDLSASAFGANANYNVATVFGWAKIPSLSTWADGTFRETFRANRDANNNVGFGRTNINNQLQFFRVATTTNKVITTTILGGVLGWFHWAMSWDTGADEFKAYIYGAQVGSTLTGIGTFIGGGTTQEFLGVSSAPSARPWLGYIAHHGFVNRVLSQPEIKALAFPRGG